MLQKNHTKHQKPKHTKKTNFNSILFAVVVCCFGRKEIPSRTLLKNIPKWSQLFIRSNTVAFELLHFTTKKVFQFMFHFILQQKPH